MGRHIYTIEELMLDDSFVNYCLSTGAAVPSDWRAIIRDNPDQEKTFAEAKKLVLALHGGLSRMEVNRQIEIVRQRLRQRDNQAAGPASEEAPSLSSAFVVTGSGRIRKRAFKKIIAVGAGICLVAACWFFFIQPSQPEQLQKSQASLVRVFKTQAGQRQTITLPDGTEVMMNANSEVSVATDFNQRRREVWLSGNAFFKVAKNPDKAFMVHSGDVTTIAVGTEFFVHGTPTGQGVQVDLLEGKVRLTDLGTRPSDAPMTLTPGQAAKYTGGSFVKQTFDSTYLRRWINGRISFNETPVLHAIKQLETWFGTRIEVKAKDLENRLISGEYNNRSLQEILKVICFSIDCNFTYTTDAFRIE